MSLNNKTIKNPLNVAYIFSCPSQIEDLEGINEMYGINFIPLDKNSLDEKLPLLKLTKNRLVLEHHGQTLFFHPNMSLLRMLSIIRGEGDRFLQATKIDQGDTVLDATMGLASDALIASAAVGDTGKVIALEASPLIHLLVQDGLKRLGKMKIKPKDNTEKEESWSRLIKAANRIEVIYAKHTCFLENLPDSSIDIIYFDPMFRQTIKTSSAIKSLKDLSYPEALSMETLKEACRIARKRIILKEKRNSGEFERLGFKMIESSHYNPVCFGTIELT